MNSVKLLIKFYMQLYDVKEFNKDQIERMVEQSEFLKSLPVMVGFKKTTQDMWLIYNKDQRFDSQVTLDAFTWRTNFVIKIGKPVLFVDHSTIFVNVEKNLKQLIVKISQILDNLKAYSTISANLSPSSILIDYNSSTETIDQIKLSNIEFLRNLKYNEY